VLNLLTAFNKYLKMLGFFPEYETISHGLRLPILRVANLLTAFNKLGELQNGKLSRHDRFSKIRIKTRG
jgi:hypothetical protein